MILEAADSGQYGEPPGELLQLALTCGEHHLPRGGGIWGQPAGLIKKLTVLLNVYRAFHSMVNTRIDMQKWAESYPRYMEIVGKVQRMRVMAEDG